MQRNIGPALAVDLLNAFRAARYSPERRRGRRPVKEQP
jgi:hypothetical protein